MSTAPTPEAFKLLHADIASTSLDDAVGDTWMGQSANFYDKPMPIMIDGFWYGLMKVGLKAHPDLINEHRGADKLEAMTNIINHLYLQRIQDPEARARVAQSLAPIAHDYFVKRALTLVGKSSLFPGWGDELKKMRDAGAYVVLATGYPDAIADALDEHLGLTRDGYVDLLINANRAGGGRPAPNMINYALRKAGMFNKDIPDEELGNVLPVSYFKDSRGYRVVCKIGDTSKDVEEGLKVGAITIATLQGTQSIEKVKEKGEPDFVVDKTVELGTKLIADGQLVVENYRDAV
jgi:phosphoglycolate phosphatase-like HAD superfamily hydrolase